MDVLDVACGTGVLFSDYIKRKVNSVTAIDLSPEMVKIAEKKYPEAPIKVILGDAEEYPFDRQFDVIMIYNAFPHFPDPEHVISCLSGHLKPGGTLCVAHGMSREALDQHHSGSAKNVSIRLLPEDDLAAIFAKTLKVTQVISDDSMYQVCGKRMAE